MEFSFFQLLILGIIVSLANVLGGLILFIPQLYRHYKRLLKYLLALCAGFMLAVTFFGMIPKTIQIWQTTSNLPRLSEDLYFPMLLLLAGYLLTHFFEHTVAPHFHLGEEIHTSHLISTKAAYTAIGGLLIHTFFDGVSISAAAQINSKIGILTFLAGFLHKFPEGFTVASMILAAGKGFKEVLVGTSIIGATTLIGVLGFYFIGTSLDYSVAYALPLAAGVTLYVAASDLIPEVNHHGGKKPLVSLSVFVGVTLFYLIHYVLDFLTQV